MDHFMLKLLGVSVFTSGSISVALQTGSVSVLPEAPPAKDPLTWAFMMVVAVVVLGAGWVVRYQLTKGTEANERMADAVRRLAREVAALKDRIS